MHKVHQLDNQTVYTLLASRHGEEEDERREKRKKKREREGKGENSEEKSEAISNPAREWPVKLSVDTSIADAMVDAST